jgi:hypothetical protein
MMNPKKSKSVCDEWSGQNPHLFRGWGYNVYYVKGQKGEKTTAIKRGLFSLLFNKASPVGGGRKNKSVNFYEKNEEDFR